MLCYLNAKMSVLNEKRCNYYKITDDCDEYLQDNYEINHGEQLLYTPLAHLKRHKI